MSIHFKVDTLEKIACNQLYLLWLYYNNKSVVKSHPFYNSDNPKWHVITKVLSTKMCSSCNRLTCNQDNFVFLIFSFQNTSDRFAREYENKKMTKTLRKELIGSCSPYKQVEKKLHSYIIHIHESSFCESSDFTWK